MSAQKQLEFNKEIERCNSLQDLFNTINKYYDTSEKLGFMALPAIKKNIPNLIRIANIKFKK